MNNKQNKTDKILIIIIPYLFIKELEFVTPVSCKLPQTSGTVLMIPELNIHKLSGKSLI